MKTKSFPLLLLFIFSFSPGSPILAQSLTPTTVVPTSVDDSIPSPPIPSSATGSPQVLSESESNTVENVRKAVQEKVQEKLSQITTGLAQNTKKAWLGTITRIDPTQIVIDSFGKTKTINIDKSVVTVGLNRLKVDPATLKEGTVILCLGYTKDADSLDAKRLVVTDPKTIIRQQIITGKIVDVSQSSPIFVLIPNTNKNLQYQIKTDTKTEIKNRSGIKQKTTSLTAGKRVAVVLLPDPKSANTYLASKIILLDTESGTPSGSPTPSVKSIPRE